MMWSCCKNKHWEYKRVFLEWSNIYIQQISVYHHTKEDVTNEDLIFLQYNLDGKVQKQYQDMCQDRYNTLC